METVVMIIMMLVSLSVLLKLTYHGKIGVIAEAIVLAASVALSWPYAITQSKTQIVDWLNNPELMLNIAVLLTVDVAIQLAFCVFTVSGARGRVNKVMRTVLLWVPGILIFPVLFACLVAVIFALPGVEFRLLAWAMAAAVVVIFPLAAWGVKWLLPENELRLEFMFLLNTLVAILGVIATVNGRTAVAGVSEVEWSALAGVIALTVLGAGVGVILYNRKKRKITIKI